MPSAGLKVGAVTGSAFRHRLPLPSPNSHIPGPIMSAIGQPGTVDLAANQLAANQFGANQLSGAPSAGGPQAAGGTQPATVRTPGAEFSSREVSGQNGGGAGGFNDLGFNDFLKLMISELQNQDPLEPMSNSEMVQQIGLIRDIGATDQLTRVLTNLSGSQELVTASNLIGRTVQGLADDSSEVTGTVDRVTVDTESENGARSVKVHVGGKTMNVKNIREIQTG